MGEQFSAECMDCGIIFTVQEGGGFAFHLLRCDKCGDTKTVAFDDLGEFHLRYLKGLSVPYSVATAKHDMEIQERADVAPIS